MISDAGQAFSYFRSSSMQESQTPKPTFCATAQNPHHRDMVPHGSGWLVKLTMLPFSAHVPEQPLVLVFQELTSWSS